MFAFGARRVGERPLGGHGDEGAQLVVAGRDAIQAGARQLDRRDLAPLDERRRFAQASRRSFVIVVVAVAAARWRERRRRRRAAPASSARERLEQRLQFGKPARLRVGAGAREPGSNVHELKR